MEYQIFGSDKDFSSVFRNRTDRCKSSSVTVRAEASMGSVGASVTTSGDMLQTRISKRLLLHFFLLAATTEENSSPCCRLHHYSVKL